jgi:CTP-dependent riboflavin kinase
MVAMETGLSLRKSKRILERMSREGYAERDVSTEGVYLYVFRGIVSNEPFEIDDI